MLSLSSSSSMMRMMNMNAAEMMRGSVRCDPLLPDPDEGWSAEDGGALELYPVVAPGTPAVDPTECLLPACPYTLRT